MLHQVIETLNSRVALRPRYENFIGGKWVAPVGGDYFDNVSPITGKTVCQIARSQAADIELALDAAHKAKDAWGKTAPAKRAEILNKIADRMEENLKVLAAVETIDNGKPIRETTFADIPLAIDHFRYFAACIRAQEGSLSEIDDDTIAYHYHEPLGVVGQIIPWNFPILMAVWKPPLRSPRENCMVLISAEQTPMSIMVLIDLVCDLLPPGVLNVVNGFGVEAGEPLAQNKRIAKIAFTGGRPPPAGEGDLGRCAYSEQSGLPASTPKPLTTFEHAWRQEIADEIHKHHDAHERSAGHFGADAVLPRRAQGRASTQP